MKRKSYIDQFLELRCATDILEIVKPVTSGLEKEVSEAISIIKKLRWVIEYPNQYNLLELCAGNPLSSILSAFTLPFTSCTAIDLHRVERNYDKIRNFSYKELNIHENKIFNLIDENTIIVAVHACNSLSTRVVDIFNGSKAHSLHLMPCCHPKVVEPERYRYLSSQLGNYRTWCFWLAERCNGKLYQDDRCLSPKNVIVSSDSIRSQLWRKV